MGWGGEGRGGVGRGGEGRVGEGANKVLQPAQSVRLRASIKFNPAFYVLLSTPCKMTCNARARNNH